MTKKILITGASGHIGKRLIPLLEKKKFKLFCIYNKSLPSKNNNNIVWIKCNLEKSIIPFKDNIKFDCTIHLSGMSGGGIGSDHDYFRINEEL